MHSLNLNLMKLSDHLLISQVETPPAKNTTSKPNQLSKLLKAP